MKNSLTTEQVVRMAELIRRKHPTNEEALEFAKLQAVQRGEDPDLITEAPAPEQPRRKAAPWYLWLPGLLIFSAITTLWSGQGTMPGTIILGLLLIYYIPNLYWKYRQRIKAEKAEQSTTEP